MRLRTLDVDGFRAIQSARVTFGRGLNVLHGPNDFGKSTLTEAIRAAFLVAPSSKEASSYATWGRPGQLARVVVTVERGDVLWRVDKTFGAGTRAKAFLDTSTDGGARFSRVAEGREVEGRLRELLSWGLSPPGGRGAPAKGDTYLTTALLGRQGEVNAIFSASLKGDQDDTGRALVTRALDALARDEVVSRLLATLQDRVGLVFGNKGRLRRAADSPLVQIQEDIKAREERIRGLEAAARHCAEIEQQVRSLLTEREAALEATDRARAALIDRQRAAAFMAKRHDLEALVGDRQRDVERARAVRDALESARREYEAAADATPGCEEELRVATDAEQVAEQRARMAREQLVRAQTARESTDELAASARRVRLSTLQAQREAATARRKAAAVAAAVADELRALDSDIEQARTALDAARQEVALTERRLRIATLVEEESHALGLTDATENARLERDRCDALYEVATLAVDAAEALVRNAVAARDETLARHDEARRSAEERALAVRGLDLAILQREATVEESRRSIARATEALARVERDDQARAALEAAEAKAGEMDANLTAVGQAIRRAETDLHRLEAMSLFVRRKALNERINSLGADAAQAQDRRRGAAEGRERAAQCEDEARRLRLPTPQQVAALQQLQEEIRRHGNAPPAPAERPVMLPVVIAALVAAIGYLGSRFVVSAGVTASLGIGAALGFAAFVAAALILRTQQRKAESHSWLAERDRLAERWRTDGEPVLADAGVTRLEDIEATRRSADDLTRNAEQLRLEAGALDRQADAILAATAGLASLQHERHELDGQLAGHDLDSLAREAADVADDRGALGQRVSSARATLDALRQQREELLPQRIDYVTRCATARSRAESARSERDQALVLDRDPAVTLSAARASLSAASDDIERLRHERGQLADSLADEGSTVSEPVVSTTPSAVDAAERTLAERRREREQAAEMRAAAQARWDLAAGALDAVNLAEIRQRIADAGGTPGAGGSLGPTAASSEASHEQAKARVAALLASVEGLETRVPTVRRKYDELARALDGTPAEALARAAKDERRLDQDIAGVECDPLGAARETEQAANELRHASEAARVAEEQLATAKSRSAEATRTRDADRARLERAAGDLEACRRQGEHVDLAAAEQALADAQGSLSGIPSMNDVAPGELEEASHAVEEREHELRACEGHLNAARGKLALVAGRAGNDRLEDEREAYEQARAYADDQELDFEASRLLLEALESAESKRASHLGRGLAKPVADTFTQLTGNLYGDLILDPDLKTEGFTASGDKRKVEDLSVGTRDQLATLIRLAIAAQLKTAIILDDQLVHSDSSRLARLRDILRASALTYDHQVLVLTCRPSDYVQDEELRTRRSDDELTVIDVRDVAQRVATAVSAS